MVYMNTNVNRGAATFVVTATGMATEVGHVSDMLQTEKGTETPLTRQLGTLTNQILVIAGIALVVSMLLNLSRGNDFNAVFAAAVAFAISAIPPACRPWSPRSCQLGTRMLAEANAIVKRLRSAETLGSTSAITRTRPEPSR